MDIQSKQPEYFPFIQSNSLSLSSSDVGLYFWGSWWFKKAQHIVIFPWIPFSSQSGKWKTLVQIFLDSYDGWNTCVTNQPWLPGWISRWRLDDPYWPLQRWSGKSPDRCACAPRSWPPRSTRTTDARGRDSWRGYRTPWQPVMESKEPCFNSKKLLHVGNFFSCLKKLWFVVTEYQ